MRTLITTTLIICLSLMAKAQSEQDTLVSDQSAEANDNMPDTTRFKMGNKEIIIIDNPGDEENEFEEDFENNEGEEPETPKSEAHWAGLDFGFTMLMNNNFENQFPDHPYWVNDPAKSHVWNLNLLEHKFNIAQHYFGITTGLGFSFTSVAFRDNYNLRSTADTLYAELDTVYTFTKNKLRASYLTVPVLLEFNTNADSDKSFYLATGVVGGVRIGSSVKQRGEYDGKEFLSKNKGVYGLNAFKLDAVARLGYGNFGAFASYSLLPIFQTGKTVEMYPLSFGLSMNF